MKKRLLTMLMILVLVVCVIPFHASAVDYQSGDYIYSINNGTATIKRYEGRESNVTVPESVTYDGVRYKISTIEAGAFEGNAYIQTLVLPAGITNLGDRAFKNCTSLSSVTIHGDVADCSYRSASAGYSYDNYSVFYNAGKNADGLTVTFGDGVTRIPAYLFATYGEKGAGDYAHVTKVVVPDTVTSIGKCAFDRCYDLAELKLGKRTESIDAWAFTRCQAMTNLDLPANLSSVGEAAFEDCLKLKKLTVNGSCNIGKAAFNGCSSLAELTFRSTCVLGDAAFKNSTGLTKLTFQGNVADCNYKSASSGYTYANFSVFYNAGKNADSLTVTFGDGVSRIPAYLFATFGEKGDGDYVHVTRVVIPDSVKEIGKFAFNRCYDLAELKLGSRIENIDVRAFQRCQALTAISLPEAVTTVGEAAFEECTRLTRFTTNGTCNLGKYALNGCTALSELTLGGTSTLGDCAFKNCTDLAMVKINGDVADCNYKSAHPSYSYEGYSVFYNAGKNVSSLTVAFGDKVTRIPAYLFATYGDKGQGDYARVTRVFIPNAVKEIGKAAFAHCYDMMEVDCSYMAYAPKIAENAFDSVVATAKYPASGFWTGADRQNYGGTLSWVAVKSPFKDVFVYDYYYAPVIWASENGITSGKPGGIFAPLESCTRCQAVTFLWRAAGCPEPQSMAQRFPDVPNTKENEFFYKAVAWAVEQGITNGRPNGNFSPHDTVNRSEFVTFLWRAEGKPQATTTVSFGDVSRNEFYYDSVRWAVEQGITNGKPGNRFDPLGKCIRGEVVTFLYRYFA